MSRGGSSEEVLLITKYVKHKKSEGSLYMMGERMAWMASTKNTFTISHNYTDIRVQKISPETKEKIQLQVVLHTSGANTFQFTNPLGRDHQKQDREAVKELLLQLLPKFKRKISSELEEKNRILQEDPELFQLYLDLVASGVITAEEFWNNRNNHKTNKSEKQTVGISAAFLSEIKPQTDGCNGLKYNLTADIIESVFKTYPAVKRKHLEYVPSHLTEAEFWTRFFQSHYFHRDRINFSNKDLFAECAQNDDKEIEQELSRPAADVLLDLTAMSDYSLGDEYGPSGSNTKQNSGNVANASLLRRFNQHSTMVLKAATTTNTSESTTNGTIINGNHQTSHTETSESNGDHMPPPQKKVRLKNQIPLDDLQPAVANTSGSSAPPLCLARGDRYLHGPTEIVGDRYETSEELMKAAHVLSQEVRGWTPRLTQVLPTSTAVSVLGELSPGGALMKTVSQQNLHQILPPDVHKEIKNMYSALAELLRHFWACFPVTSPELEEKVRKMRSNLDKFQQAKLLPLKEKLHSNHYNALTILHLEKMLEAAYTKFKAWQNKKMKRGR